MFKALSHLIQFKMFLLIARELNWMTFKFPSNYDSMILWFMLHHNSGYKNIPLYSTKSMPPFTNDTTNNAGSQGSSGRNLVAAKEKLTQEMRHWLLQAAASSSLPLLQRCDFFKVHSKASGRSQHQKSTWRAAFFYH